MVTAPKRKSPMKNHRAFFALRLTSAIKRVPQNNGLGAFRNGCNKLNRDFGDFFNTFALSLGLGGQAH